MLGMCDVDVEDVACQGCAMFGMWDVGDVECLVLAMLRL